MISESAAPKRSEISSLLDEHDPLTYEVLKNAYPVLDGESIEKILSDVDSYRK